MTNFYDLYWKGHKSDQPSDFNYKWSKISKYIPKNKKIKILDFGCGTGRIFQELVNKNPKSKIIGMDVSKYALKTISKKFPKYNFYTTKDGEKLPLKNGSVDFIVALDVIEHVYNTQLLLEEFNRILSPDGNILISTPYHGLIKNLIIATLGFEKVFDPCGAHIRFFTKKSLFNSLIKANFKILKHGYYGRFYPLSRGMFVLANKTGHNIKGSRKS